MTVDELKTQLSRYDGDTPIIFINHPHRGSSVVFRLDDPDEVSAQKEDRFGLIEDREEFKDYLVFPIFPSGDDYRLEDDGDWPGRSRD